MKKILAVLFACVLAIAMPAAAFAEGGNGSGGGGGNGSGGGNGGGSAEPLTVVSTSIEENASLDAIDSITLVFSKNVCDASVRDANQSLVAVADAQGNPVPFAVVLADDQVEPDKRNDMTVEFAQPLEAGAYTLTAQAGITSKSGDTLAQDYVLNFTVNEPESNEPAASASSASSASASASSSATASTSASASAAASASSKAASSSTASGGASGQQGGPNTLLIVGGIVVAVVVIAGVVLFARKRK